MGARGHIRSAGVLQVCHDGGDGVVRATLCDGDAQPHDSARRDALRADGLRAAAWRGGLQTCALGSCFDNTRCFFKCTQRLKAHGTKKIKRKRKLKNKKEGKKKSMRARIAAAMWGWEFDNLRCSCPLGLRAGGATGHIRSRELGDRGARARVDTFVCRVHMSREARAEPAVVRPAEHSRASSVESAHKAR